MACSASVQGVEDPLLGQALAGPPVLPKGGRNSSPFGRGPERSEGGEGIRTVYPGFERRSPTWQNQVGWRSEGDEGMRTLGEVRTTPFHELTVSYG